MSALLLPPPSRGRLTTTLRFARLQIGAPCRVRGKRGLPWSPGVVVEKSVHHNDFYGQQPTYSLVWVRHRAGVGCFWPNDVKPA